MEDHAPHLAMFKTLTGVVVPVYHRSDASVQDLYEAIAQKLGDHKPFNIVLNGRVGPGP